MAAMFVSQADSFEGDYSIRKRMSREGTLEALHYHDFYELQIYCAQMPGASLGTAALGEKTYELKQGDIFLIPSLAVHAVHLHPRADGVCYSISLSSAFLMHTGSGDANLFAIYDRAAGGCPLRHMPAEELERFQELCREYERQEALLAHGRSFLEQAFLFRILALVYNLCYEETPVDPTDALHRAALTNLIHYVDAHIAEELSLSRLAAVTNFSVYHLCRVFKKYMGVTLNKYIVSRRIENAKILLGTQLPIQNISKRVGFNNYNHFYRCFRQITGENPAEYRKLLAAKTSADHTKSEQ